MTNYTTPISVRFRASELDRIDALKEELHLPSRAEVLRTSLELLAAEASRPYRSARRAENAAIKIVDELRAMYGATARADFEYTPDGAVEWTVGGEEPPESLRAELDRQAELAVLRIIDDSQGLALQPGVAFRWDDIEAGDVTG